MPETNNVSPILEMVGITKRFPGLVALDHVDLSVRRGEIHALIGQNGAGKSTLMKVLSGVYPIEEGEIHIDGQAVRFNHPREALQLGVGTVYQDLSLVDKLSVADNIFLGRETNGGFVINESSIWKRSEDILSNLGVRHINVKAQVGRLPLAQQQLVEIAKVLSHEPRILVLDEPTAPLGDEETTLLFNILNGLKARGIAIIFISHRFKEIMQHCDRATILRNGKLITTVNVAGISEEALVELTIGEQIETFYRHNPAGENKHHETALEVENLSVGNHVRNVSFTLHRGEILGITGLLGAGQQQLVRALFGDQRAVSGTIKRDGRTVTIHSPAQALKLGIGLLTEYRKVEGLVLDMSVREN
ncbi:MAG: sugar ABC transporter ATP-binding protein, partial [Burkholderiales bacterium]|nr:sugar ABC transporter ATP-binding protein [Anaerolineae bacterium]